MRLRPRSAYWLLLFLAVGQRRSQDIVSSKTEPAKLVGRVEKLTDVLKTLGTPVDSEPFAGQVVLKDPKGVVTPLLCDDASRALFQDERLRGRPTEITGRTRPGFPYLQVLSFKVEEEGRFRTPEYYCVICTISVRFPQICPCCQGPMELRMRPERP